MIPGMLPGEVPSDRDLERSGRGEAAERLSLLIDINGEFEDAAQAFAFWGVALPALFVASAYFGWTDTNPAIQVFIAAVLFVALMAVSLYALVWSRWTRKRLTAVNKRMEVLETERKAGKRPYEQF